MASSTSDWPGIREWQQSDDMGRFGSPPESWLVGVAAVAAGFATRRALLQLWKQVRGSDPPVNPAAAGVSWKDAILWGLAVGAFVGVARVATRRGVTSLGNDYLS